MICRRYYKNLNLYFFQIFSTISNLRIYNFEYALKLREKTDEVVAKNLAIRITERDFFKSLPKKDSLITPRKFIKALKLSQVISKTKIYKNSFYRRFERLKKLPKAFFKLQTQFQKRLKRKKNSLRNTKVLKKNTNKFIGERNLFKPRKYALIDFINLA